MARIKISEDPLLQYINGIVVISVSPPFPKRYKFLWKMTSGIVPAYLTTLLDLLTGYGFGTAIRASVTKFSSFSPACSSTPPPPSCLSPPHGPWTQRGVLPLTRWRFHSQFTLAGIFVYPIYIARTSVKGEEKTGWGASGWIQRWTQSRTARHCH